VSAPAFGASRWKAERDGSIRHQSGEMPCEFVSPILRGPGILNLKKLVSDGLVEFRAFAGTTSLHKIEHHLATVLGLCRRAAQVQCLGGFKKNNVQVERTRNAVEAVKFLWDYLGWAGSSRPVALGLFGRLHEDFKDYRNDALRLCAKFDAR